MSRYKHRNNETKSVKKNDDWMATYGDMVTLLLCFFVLLFSISTVDIEKFRLVAMSLQDALSGVLDSGRTYVPEEPLDEDALTEMELENYLREMEQLQSTYEELRQFFREQGLEDAVLLIYEERGLLIRFSDKVLFDSARAELHADAVAILAKIAVALEQLPNDVIIEGHTDNRPLIDTSVFASNWELSTARAINVARYLMEEKGIIPERLGIAGYAKYRPIASNQTTEGRQQNRRVDVVIKRLSVLATH